MSSRYFPKFSLTLTRSSRSRLRPCLPLGLLAGHHIPTSSLNHPFSFCMVAAHSSPRCRGPQRCLHSLPPSLSAPPLPSLLDLPSSIYKSLATCLLSASKPHPSLNSRTRLITHPGPIST